MSNSQVRTTILPLVCLLVSVGVGFGEPSDPLLKMPIGKVEITPPEIIIKTQAAPVFPPAAKAGRFTGEVIVDTLIGVAGRVERVRVAQSTHPNVGFEEAAIEAVKKWRFHPAESNGDPVPYEAQFKLTFDRYGTGVYTPTSLASGSFVDVRWKSLNADRTKLTGGRQVQQRAPTSGGSPGTPSRR